MRRFTISLLLMLLTVASFAQFNLSANITNVPQGISYQAVVRDGSNIIAANEEFEVQITISAELANGTTASEYTETHTVKTNENGLFTLVIGQGSSSLQFSEFNWAIQGATYKIATQTPYGSDTAQLLSVPFAFYAANAGNIDTKAIAAALSNEDVQKLLNFVKTADVEALLAEYAKKDAIPTVPTKVSAFENDANYITEHQDISGKANKSEMTITAGDDADKATIQLKEGTSATVLTAHQSLEGYATINDIPTKVSELENDAEYLTAHQDISGKADKVDMTITPGTGANADKATIQLKKGTSATVLTAHQSLEGYATISDIPTKVSELENDAEYITANALSNYYTKKQSDDKYALKTDAYTKAESDERYVKSEKVYTKSEVDALINDKITFLSMEGEIEAKYSVSASKKVAFSKGNLQYNYNSKQWSFAEEQYNTVDKTCVNSSTTPKKYEIGSNKKTDLFWWATSGWNNGKNVYSPLCVYVNNTYNNEYRLIAANQTLYVGGDMSSSKPNADWGVYNAITNGENKAGVWRTLTEAEWDYLLRSRPRASYKRCLAQIAITSNSSSVKGLLLLPDNWEEVSVDDNGTATTRVKNAVGTTNYAVLGDAQLKDLEKKYGVVFLPSYRGHATILAKGDFGSSVEYNGIAFGYSYNNKAGDDNKAFYWSSTDYNTYSSYAVDPLKPGTGTYKESKEVGGFVRLVRDL
ncbi:MAG: hypothetical protein E7069_09215 [Bacteroidales bacterium]|nr:hypothetical protein [Bacteroidales bacterium]